MEPLKQITSSNNEQFRELKKLLSSHGLKKSEHYLLSGDKVLKELLISQPQSVQYAIYPAEEMHLVWKVPGLLLSRDLFDELDVMGTGGPLMTVKKPKPKTWISDEPKGLQLFCPLGDPKNVGALLRSALAFGVSSVILLKESASPYLPEALRAAAGSHLHLELKEGPSLKDLRGTFVTLEGKAEQSIVDWSWPEDVNILVGEEGPGLIRAQGIKRRPLSIPTDPRLESLNAAVAASLALYSYRQCFPL